MIDCGVFKVESGVDVLMRWEEVVYDYKMDFFVVGYFDLVEIVKL